MPHKCTFYFVRKPKEELINYALEKAPAMAVGKFLIPEFNNEFGITIEDLKQLQLLIDKLDAKHQYEKVIFDSYIENNEFTLTEEQLQKAYDTYKEARVKSDGIKTNVK